MILGTELINCCLVSAVEKWGSGGRAGGVVGVVQNNLRVKVSIKGNVLGKYKLFCYIICSGYTRKYQCILGGNAIVYGERETQRIPSVQCVERLPTFSSYTKGT